MDPDRPDYPIINFPVRPRQYYRRRCTIARRTALRRGRQTELAGCGLCAVWLGNDHNLVRLEGNDELAGACRLTDEMIYRGKLYGIYSAKWLYLSSVVLFEAGSALCGAAPSMNAFIVGRAIAGLGVS